MKAILALVLGLVLSIPVSAGHYSTHVYIPHDKFPSQHLSGGENECSEPPDGDKNCDDPGTRGVPEPATLALMAIGLGGLALRRRR